MKNNTTNKVMYQVEIDANGKEVKTPIYLMDPSKFVKRIYGKGTFYMQNKLFENFIINDQLTIRDLKVLSYLKSKVGRANKIEMYRQSEIVAALPNISQADVSRILKKLVELDIIYIKDNFYYFNIKYIYSGK